MKKIYMATFFTRRSYGAVLQATALNNFLNGEGYDAVLINYDPDRSLKRGFKSDLKDLIYFVPFYRRKKNTLRFIEENIRKTKKFVDFSDLKKLDSDESIFVAGSDQIWNPKRCDDFFFLRFVERGKKISYAASMGTLTIQEDKKDKFKRYVNDFDIISARESSMADSLADMTDKPVKTHVDPTLLMPREFWESKEREYIIGKPYILLFPIYWDEKYNALLEKLHKETGCEIVALSQSPRIFCTKRVHDADPGQFIYLIHHAQSVVTSSYHGTAFSLIFKKMLYAVVNPNQPSRINDLLKKFGFESAFVKDSFDVGELDYSEFDSKLEAERQKVRQFFIESTGDPND